MTVSGSCYRCGAADARLVAASGPDAKPGEQWGRWICASCVYEQEMGRDPAPLAAPPPRPTKAERLHPQSEVLFTPPAPQRAAKRPPT